MSKLYFTVGLPGSGKSHWAETHKDELNAVVHSSDAIIKEFGDENDQSKNELVFDILHNRVKEDLLSGKNVCYDATNISRRRRIHFIDNILRDIPCEKVCVLFATPIISCRKNNKNRKRKVPDDVITRMYKGFEVPCKQEGWDDIQIVWWDWNKDELNFDVFSSLKKWSTLAHDNPHHKFSIGDHMFVAYNHYMNDVKHENKNNLLADCILLHDCGKPVCKAFIDSKGNPSETAHFYNHHNVSAFLSLFYLKELGYTDEEILYASLLIELHMREFLAWKDSKKAKEKDRRLFGDDIVKLVEEIHKYDLAAH